MRTLLFSALLVGCQTGLTPVQDARIDRGASPKASGAPSAAAPGELGFVVSLHDFYGPLCSGARVGAEWVLTNAGCVADPSDLFVEVGGREPGQGAYAEVADVVLHPGWDGLYANLALVRIVDPGVGGAVAVADPWADSVLYAPGQTAVESGWGTGVLSSHRAPILEPSVCQGRFDDADRELPAGVYCLDQLGLDPTCIAEHGSPITTDGSTGEPVLLGIAGIPMGCALVPGAFSPVDAGWISAWVPDARIGADHHPTPDDHGNDFASATQVTLAAGVLAGALHPGDRDMFWMHLPPGVAVNLRSHSTMDPTVRVYDADGAVLGTDDDRDAGSNPLDFELLVDAAGTPGIYIEVFGYADAQTGDYRVDVTSTTPAPVEPAVDPEPDDGDSRDLASPLFPGATEAALHAGDVDVFSLYLTPGEHVTLYSSGDTDTRGTLRDAWGTMLESDDDGGAGLNFDLGYTALSEGVYYLEVEGYALTTEGPYTVHRE